ncbi:MAG: prepilin-type N-terminal cleavage/methylation domain-containing protein [Sedimentisphaerales bacterium]|nr:prepilin-type N-terminal cleavage/methylation domain-containing protein [Sedimentisphaerales bacterium]
MKQRTGFTLIELLVVIAIIGILLAILVPGLQKAKEATKTVICKSHLKGIGTAMLVYLEQNEGRAYDSSGSNKLLWYNPDGSYIDPDIDDAYWGVAYKDYAEDPKVFGCPSYQKVATILYTDYDPDVARYAGFALNSFFFRDVRASSNDPFRKNRKLSDVQIPYQFIITHDHVEPRIEGDSAGGEQDDMFYIPQGQGVNLRHYRPTTSGGKGGREEHYWAIFRHNKKDRALDNPTRALQRITQIKTSPNGRANTLFLDGHVDHIFETTGENIRKTWYSGYTN